jgi:hypothetical protein
MALGGPGDYHGLIVRTRSTIDVPDQTMDYMTELLRCLLEAGEFRQHDSS